MKKAFKRLFRFYQKSSSQPYLKSAGRLDADTTTNEVKINISPKNADLMKKNYALLFLKKRTSASKRQTYVNQQLYEQIAGILAVIDKDLTVPTFIDNVLEEHLKQHKAQINTLYEDRYCKPL